MCGHVQGCHVTLWHKRRARKISDENLKNQLIKSLSLSFQVAAVDVFFSHLFCCCHSWRVTYDIGGIWLNNELNEQAWRNVQGRGLWGGTLAFKSNSWKSNYNRCTDQCKIKLSVPWAANNGLFVSLWSTKWTHPTPIESAVTVTNVWPWCVRCWRWPANWSWSSINFLRNLLRRFGLGWNEQKRRAVSVSRSKLTTRPSLAINQAPGWAVQACVTS